LLYSYARSWIFNERLGFQECSLRAKGSH
jgi:hypothetical protein